MFYRISCCLSRGFYAKFHSLGHELELNLEQNFNLAYLRKLSQNQSIFLFSLLCTCTHFHQFCAILYWLFSNQLFLFLININSPIVGFS